MCLGLASGYTPRYTVKDVVCDYGVFEKDKLILILNSKKNALRIAEILEADLRHHTYSIANAKKVMESVIDNTLSNENEREIIKAYLKGMKQHEIAEKLNVSQSTVSRAINSAKDKIREPLQTALSVINIYDCADEVKNEFNI